MAWFDGLALSLRRKLPVILQTEAAECGLACLGMVLGYHGLLTDLATLRARHSVSLKGMTLTTLSEMAHKENLGHRAVRLELGEMGGLRLPAILHWELNHFVVLKAVSGGKITVHDPDVGERTYTLAQASTMFTGIALELWPDPGFEPRKETQPVALGSLIGQISGFLPALAQVLALSLVLQLFTLVAPLFMQWVVDHVVVSRDANLLTTLALGFILLLAFQQAVGILRTWLLLAISTSVRVQWKANVFNHLLRLPLGYFQKRHLGDIVSRTGSIDDIQRVLTSAFVESIFDGLMVIFTLVLMLLYSPILAGLSLAGVAVYLLLRVLWFRPLYMATEEQIVRAANLSTHYLETIRGMRAIKLFERQLERQNAWQTLFISETNATLSIQKLKILYNLAKTIVGSLLHIGLVWMGTLQILNGSLSVGMLMAFLAFRSQFESRVMALIDQFMELKMLRLYGERLADVVLTPAEAPQLARSGAAQIVAPTIDINDLRFRYADHDPWVLDGVTLRIEAGEAVAIVGPSGGGKTTLANVLLGVLTPSDGSVRIGGVPLGPNSTQQWRSQVGTVMQDDTLFAGSIAENISFFDAKSDPERIEYCAHVAAIASDIEAMPMGYQTLVGDMGAALSGGQKQRVLLARALYKQPAVLLLDEATSHLDIKREAEVTAAIAALKITRIVIAHRPETISAASRVIELEMGKVAFVGSPQEYLVRLGAHRSRNP